MTKENFLGKIVTLNEKFLLGAYGFDDNVQPQNVPIQTVSKYMGVLNNFS